MNLHILGHGLNIYNNVMKEMSKILFIIILIVFAGCDLPSRICIQNKMNHKISIVDATSDYNANDGRLSSLTSVLQGEKSGWLPFSKYYIINDDATSAFKGILDVNEVWDAFQRAYGRRHQDCNLNFDFYVELYEDRLILVRFGRIRILNIGENIMCYPHNVSNNLYKFSVQLQ